MPVRVPYTRPATSADGRPNPGAAVSFYYRGTPWSPPVYAAATGGSALSQPRTPDADGRVAVWVDAGRYDIVENHSGLLVRTEWEAFPQTTEPWTNLSLINSWVANGGYATPGYMRTTEGIVLLRGVISGGAAGTQIASALPAAYRPVGYDANPYLSVNVSTAAGRTIGVTQAGVITASDTGPVGLDGVWWAI